MPGTRTAITGGRVVPIEGEPIDGGTVLVENGKIAAIGGPGFEVPADTEVIDASCKWVLPGFIDAHAHVGVHEEAEGWEGNDTNEGTRPVTAYVRALDAINPADIGFRDAISGGVLAVNVNPGSGNPIGGQTVALKCWGRTVDQMLLREPSGLKSALGENPKRRYGELKQTPSTRLGTAAVIREAFVQAGNYLARLAHAEQDSDRKPAERDLNLEALGRVLRREIPWRQHCHRADDIATAMRIAREFGYDLVIDHGTEAHLLADLIAAESIPVIIGPLFTSRSKVELRNRSLANPGKLAAAGVTIAITTHPLPHPPGHPGRQRRPGSRNRAPRHNHQPGPHHRRSRPPRLPRVRQRRRPGHLVRRPPRRNVPGRTRLPKRPPNLRLRPRPTRSRLQRPVTHP
jgi:imidazolonepropionase-like amidohydrolase